MFLRRPPRVLLFVVVAVVGLAADLATKAWIFGRLGMPSPRPPIWIVRPYFSLTTSLNEGALWGLGQGWTMLFVLLSFAAVGAIGYIVLRGEATASLTLTLALACILAGVLGNLYDRLGLPGLTWNLADRFGDPVYAVRDWLHFEIPGVLDWPVFNIADSLLVVGTASIVLLSLFHDFAAWKAGREQPSEQVADAATSSR